MASKRKNGGATLDDVVEVLGNLLKTVQGQGGVLKQHSQLLKQHGQELKRNGEELKRHGDVLKQHVEELKRQRQELRVHSGLLEHVVQEQRIQRAQTELVVERLDRMTEALLRSRTLDTELFDSHGARIARLESAVFSGPPAPGP